jgi:predicted nucleotidyltransferase
MTAARKKQVMQEIGRTARSVAPMAKRILLFGSRARGDAREDSDWDVLVLLDKDRIRLEDIDNVSYPLRELGWELGEDINTVLYTVNDWDKSSFTPFHKNVEAEAIAL